MKHAQILLAAFVACISAHAQTWDFSEEGLSDTDVTNLAADDDNWTYDSTNDRYTNTSANLLTAAALTANGETVNFTNGLLFTVTVADGVRLDNKKLCLTLNKASTIVTIPNATAGYILTISSKSSSSSKARGFVGTNIEDATGILSTDGLSTSTDQTTSTAVVTADGDVTIRSTGGMYIYSISLADPSTTSSTPTSDNSVALNTLKNQVKLTTTDNQIKYYNTEDINNIAIGESDGTVTVTPASGEWEDVFTRSVSNIGFSKKAETGSEGEIAEAVDGGVVITEAQGWYESIYAKWTPLSTASSYNVYIKGGQYTDFTQVDSELIRQYSSYYRVDVVGLQSPATYEVKVVPVDENSAEQESLAGSASSLATKLYSRAGFAFMDDELPGAYNADGTLKSNAKVIYVTAANAQTISYNGCTGLQAILDESSVKTMTVPLDIRVIGLLTLSDLDYIASSGEGLQIKNNKSPITLEGIGEDATLSGFGLFGRNSTHVEYRNLAVMCFIDDGISLDTKNLYTWVHHMDIFYGNTGGDSDQTKGDGSLDVKGNSQYQTYSYNHFWDSGKMSLCGMKSEDGPNYLNYDHNWFDHSDSRHPRVRTMTVHVWNNYFDGNAKYGVGATMGASVFVENNYFRNAHDPMMISGQGTDATGSGTFSGEAGGMIKEYGNVFAENNTNGVKFQYVTHKDDDDDFDCYAADSRDEQVPSSYTTVSGGYTYNNFDTDSSLMYDYDVDDAADVPALVTGYWGAGRLNHGDFQWTFDNSTEDSNYSIITELKTALTNYSSSLVAYGDGSTSSSSSSSSGGSTDTDSDTDTDTGDTSDEEDTSSSVDLGEVILTYTFTGSESAGTAIEVDGGSVTFSNINTGTTNGVIGNKIDSDASAGKRYVLVTLNEALTATDQIAVSCYTTAGTPSSNKVMGAAIYATLDGDLLASLPLSAKSTNETLVTTVPSELVGATSFYICRCAGYSIFFTGVTVAKAADTTDDAE